MNLKEIQTFREAIKRVTTILAGKNIPVIERGTGASVSYNSNGDPVAINIPSIPDTASDLFISSIRGFVDHEVAHILFTDSKYLLAHDGDEKLKLHYMVNAVEDVYIEKKISSLYAGSQGNLTSTREHIIEQVFAKQVFDVVAAAKSDIALFKSFFLVPVLRSWAGQVSFEDYMEKHGDCVSDVVKHLESHGVDDDIRNLSSTQDSVRVAGKILKLLKELEGERKKEEKKRKEKSSDSSKSKTDEQPEQEESGRGDEESEEDKGSDPSSDEEDEEQKPEPEPEEDSADADEDEDEDEDEDGETLSYEDAIKLILEQEESSAVQSYRPYQRTFDFKGKIEDFPAFMTRNANRMNDIDDPFGVYDQPDKYEIHEDRDLRCFNRYIKNIIGDESLNIAKELERAIASKNRTMFVPGQKKGKVHGPSLHRLSVGDDRIFRTREEKRAVNACAQIVIDLSGSMDGARIKVACAAAYTLAKALDAIRVPCIITGFTTYGHPTKKKDGFSRYEGLYLPIVKDWHEKADTTKFRAALGFLGSRLKKAQNIDGESIRELSSHFNNRREDRKLMIVLSDGQPQGLGTGFAQDLKLTVEQMKSTDIEVFGLGIQSNAPTYYYEKSAVVNDLSELGTTLISHIKSTLL